MLDNGSIVDIAEERVFFPYIFAVYFVLSVYELNISQVHFTDIFFPLSTILICTLLSLQIVDHLIDSKKKSGLIVFIFMIPVLTYGVQLDIFLINTSLNFLGADLASGRYLLSLNILIGSIASFAVYKSESKMNNPVKIVNIVTACLFIFVTANILLFHIGATETSLNNNLRVNSSSAQANPSIYYLVPDRYARNDVLEGQYDFNNSNFTNSLRKEGFYIADRSYANYPRSYLSLTTSLNMQHAEDLGIKQNTPEKEVYKFLKNHRVQKFLKNQGYDYYHVSNWYPPTSRNENAKITINNHQNFIEKNLGRFNYILVKNTPFRVYFDLAKVPKHRAVNKNFQGLKEISKKGGEKFVFAHLITPHSAYKLSPNANAISYEANVSEKEKYINQLRGTNKLLNETVNEILEHEGNNTVIIIQSDEGPGKHYWNWDEINKSNKREKAAIINAIYAPRVDRSKLNPRMTPVNTFRIVFNSYFGSDLALQENEVYFKKRDRGHNFLKANESVLYSE